MVRSELYIRIAAVLTTLLESDGAPESMLYLGIGANMDDWATVRDILRESGLVTIKAHYVTLTPKGINVAHDLNTTADKAVARCPSATTV